MQVSVNFKNFDSSDALKSYVQGKLDKLDKLLDSPVEANVVFSVEKIRHIAEVTLTGDRLNIHATEESESMYSSIDMVVDKIRKQIKKTKEKTRERRPVSKNGIKDGSVLSEEDDESEPEASSTVLVETMDYKPMDVEEAILQFSTGSDLFFVFTNAATDKVNVIYKKGNGDIAVIQPK